MIHVRGPAQKPDRHVPEPRSAVVIAALFATSFLIPVPVLAQVDISGYYLPMKVALKAAESAIDSCAAHGWDVTATWSIPPVSSSSSFVAIMRRSTPRIRPIARPIQSSRWVRSSASRARANSSHSSRKHPTAPDLSSRICRTFSPMRVALRSSGVLKSWVDLVLAVPREETGTKRVLPMVLQPSRTALNQP